MLEEIVPVIFGSNALFAFLTYLITRHDNRNDVEAKHYKEIKEELRERNELNNQRYEEHQKAIASITEVLAKLEEKDDAIVDLQKKQTESLVGLGHDRIIYLGLKYIQRGFITVDEYENLNEFLYKPYHNAGGNGSASRVMQAVNNLPIRPTPTVNKKEVINHE